MKGVQPMKPAFPVSTLGMLLLSFCLGCSGHQLQVKELPEPEYPIVARTQNIQGEIGLILAIGTDGKVIYVQGSPEDPPALVQGAEDNARQWVFGPFAPDETFPVYREVTYVFRIESEGSRSDCIVPPKVITHLPDRIEIITTPCSGDHMDITPNKPPSNAPRP